MAISKSLRRLLAVRALAEEQRRAALEAALGAERRLEAALEQAGVRNRRGRRLVEESARSGQTTDRLAGVEETRGAESQAAALEGLIEAAREQTAQQRQSYLDKRIERRQAETLLEEAAARERLEQERRAQQSLDDWGQSQRRKPPMAHGESASSS
jgi:hypothetical protein